MRAPPIGPGPPRANVPPRRRRLALVHAGLLIAGLGAQPAPADFVWLAQGPALSTRDIRALDPSVPFACLETAHFKIACALAPMRLPADAEERRRLEQELKALAAQGIEVPRPGGRLDEHARARLYGLRLERLYGEFLALLGLGDADFPAKPRPRGPGYTGEGAYLGMPDRFTVLLVEDDALLDRFTQAWCKRRGMPAGTRHLFQPAGSLFLGIAADANEGQFRADRVLHGAVVYNTVHNLIDAFRYYWHETPYWLQDGAAHWFRRHVLEDLDLFTCLPPDLPERNRRADWRATAAARARLGNFTPLREVLTWIDDRPVAYGDQVAMWSRVDFLARRHPGAFGRILRAVKGPLPADQEATPPHAVLVERQRAALEIVLGLDPDGFDKAWVASTRDPLR